MISFFAYLPEIWKVIYTANAIESLNMSLRKVTKARGSFPNDEAIFKLLYLPLRNIAKKSNISCTTGKPRSTVLASSTKTGSRLNSHEIEEMKSPGKNPGLWNG